MAAGMERERQRWREMEWERGREMRRRWWRRSDQQRGAGAVTWGL